MEAGVPVSTPEADSLKHLLHTIALKYPPNLIAAQLVDINRIAFHVQLVRDRVPPGGAICDIGGGIGLFSLACAAIGLRVLLVDDFRDEINQHHGSLLDLHREYGVEVLSADVLKSPPQLEPESLHAVTAFDVLEHLHHSPRALLHALADALTAEGIFLVSTPNSANLKKRLLAIFGKTSWSSFESWYQTPVFRGHVREPIATDLRLIAEDLHLRDVRIFGRNWLGHDSPTPLVRFGTRLADGLLARRPTLCSDLYLIGLR